VKFPVANRIREVKRDKYSKHWLRDDGQFDAEIHIDPIHHPSSDHPLGWEDDDLNWEFEPGFGHKVKRANHQLRLWTYFLRFGFAEGVYVDYTLPAKLPKDAVGQDIVIENSWDKTDLKFTVTPTGIKEDIILKETGHPTSFSFPVKTNGCTLTNELQYVDKDGNIIGRIEIPYMVDADGKIGNVSAFYNGVYVVFEVDKDFLLGASYPIIVDPTTTFSVGATGSIYGRSTSYSTARSTGTSSIGTLQYGQVYDGRSYYSVYRALVEYDTTSISSDMIISSVSLPVNVIQNVSGVSLYTGLVKGPNGTSTSYYNTFGSSSYDTMSSTLTSKTFTGFEALSTKAGTTRLGFRTSREMNSTVPTSGETIILSLNSLTITYNANQAPNTPAVTTPGTVDASATLSAGATDPDGNDVFLEFELSTDGGGTYKSIGVTGNVQSGTVGSITYDFTSEPASTQAKLRVRARDTGGLYSVAYGFSNLFVISHNQPPTTPTVGSYLQPVDGVVQVSATSTDPNGGSLTYYFELSTDNGVNYHSIGSVWVNGGGQGVMTYDFSNEPATTTARIRARASDGSLYSGYGYNNIFTIQHSPATVTLKSYTRSKISDEPGMTISTVIFQSSQNLTQWEARADGSGAGQGLLVGSGGAVSANTDISFDVDYSELTSGDKIYRINIYGKNASGVWNNYE
jgi:hypothetical protein